MAIYDGIYAEVAFVVWRYESGGYLLQSVPGIVKRGKGYILRQVLLYGSVGGKDIAGVAAVSVGMEERVAGKTGVCAVAMELKGKVGYLVEEYFAHDVTLFPQYAFGLSGCRVPVQVIGA